MIDLVIAIVVTVLLSLCIIIRQSCHRQPIQCTEKQSYRSELVVSHLLTIPDPCHIARIRYSLESEEETELNVSAVLCHLCVLDIGHWESSTSLSGTDAEYRCVHDILPSCMVHPIEETMRIAVAKTGHTNSSCCTIDEMAAVSSIYYSFPLEETSSITTVNNNTNDQLVLHTNIIEHVPHNDTHNPISETTRSSLVTGRATTLGADFIV